MLILRYLYDHPHLLGTSFLRQTRPFRGSLRELVATLGVQGREDARNLTSLRARRRSPGGLEQPPGGWRRKTRWRCVMPLNSRDLSEKIPEHKLGSLGSCLVEGDPEQRRGERRVRRRSLVISILVQAAVIALLVLLPLFGKSERLSLASAYIPIPPYGHLHRAAGPARPIPGHHVN